MKRKPLLFLLLFALLAPWAVKAQQSLTDYTFSTDVTTFNSIVSTGTQLSFSNDDDGYATCTFPFAFPYGESSFALGASIACSANGFIYLGATSASGTTGSYTNTTYSAVNAFLQQDGHIGRYTGDDPSGAWYKYDETAGTFTIEYHRLGTYSSPYGSYTYQVVFHTNGNIEFIYGEIDHGTATSRTLATYLTDGPKSDFAFVTGAWADPTFSTTYATRPLSPAPEVGRRYTFTRPVATCFRPQNLEASLTPGNGSIATLTWERHVQGTENAWVLEYGTASDFTGATSVPVSGTPSQDLTGLTAEQTYYARVKPDCDTDGSLWSATCTFTPTDAYTITVNDGTSTSYYVPFYYCTVNSYYTNYSNMASQFIIPAAALTSIQWASIEKLTFYNSLTTNNYNGATFKVYAGETTATTQSSYTDWATLTNVYTGTVSVSDNVMTIEFDTPFTYSTGNLLIGFKLNTAGTSNGSSCTWKGVSASSGSSIYTSSGTSVTQASFLPKVTIEYRPGEAPACLPVEGLVVNDFTSNEAIITWTSTESAWQLVYSTDANFDPDAATPIAVSGTPTQTLSGLSPLTDYYVYVRSNCTASNNGYSDWSSKIHFKTLAMAVAVGDAWSDDFEGESCGWELVNGTQTNKWVWGTAVNNGGTHAMYVSNNNGTSNAYTTGSQSVVYATKLLSFAEAKYQFAYNWQANGESSWDYLKVWLAPASFVFTPGQLPNGATSSFSSYTSLLPTGWIALDGGTNLNGVTGWQSKELAVNVPEGNYYLVFMWCNDGSSGTQPPAAVDNVSINRVYCNYEVQGLAVSDITTNSAIITWTDGDPGEWQVATKAGNDGWITLTDTYTTNSATLSLNPSTSYQVRVRAYCGPEANNQGAWCTPISFDTECEAITSYPYSENFDSYAGGSGSSNSLPLCWDYINTTSYSYYVGYPTIYSASGTSHSGNNHLRFYSYYYPSTSTNYDPQPQYAILPGVENPSNMRVKLYARANSTSNNYDATFMVGVMEGNNFVGIDTIKPTTTTYQMYTIPLDRYTGTGTHIAIMIEAADATATSSNYHSVFIDDVTVEPLPDCPTPTGLMLVSNSQTPEGATIKWNNVEGASWIVEYKKAVDTEWTAISPAVTDTIYTFMGLEPSTGYQARVSVVCTGLTYPTDPVNFNTKVRFPAPTNLVTSNLTHNSVTLAWTAGYTNQTDWKVEYKKSSDDWTAAVTETVSNPTIDLSELVENTTYNVRVYGGIGTEFGTNALSGSFTTKYPCAAPTALVISNITNNSATLGWTPGYQETEWTVLYWPEEATDTLRRVVNGSPTVNLTDLRAFTTYNVRVINCENALAGSFVTATVVPLIEAFATTSAPKGWNKYTGLLEYVLSDSIQLSSTTGGWSFNTRNGVLDGVHVYGNIYGSSFKYWLVTPTVLMENNVDLRFDLALTDYNNADPIEDPTAQADDRFVVLISVNGGNWTILREWNNTGSEYVYNTISTTGEKVVCDLSSYAGQYVSIAFYGESTVGQNGDNDLHFDNVSIDYIPSCEKPLGLAVADSTITATSAVATWEAGNATKWNLQYKRTTDTVWIPVNGLTEATYTFDTLVGGTSYEVQVQADCGDNGTSAWTDSKLFTTKLCSPEDMCEITFVLTDAWGDSWNNAYIEVIDVLTGITLGEVANENLNGTSGSGENEVNIKTLAVCDGREIQFVWHTGSYDNEASYVITSALGDEIINGSGGFSTPVNYIVNCTLDPCDAPNGLAAETTYNSAALSWNGAAENYYVRYREAGVNIENFTQVGADETTTADYVLYTYDLSSYNGQSGYIAIRHYNCTDQNLLLIDDVTLNNGTDNVFSYNFDNGVLPNGIEFYDMDGDGFNWDLDEIYQYDYDEWEYIYYAHSGTYCLYSASYDSDEGELTPDNWIILPYVEDLGCTLTFYARGFDSGYPDEVFGVFVTTEQNFVNEWINVPDIVSDTSYNLTGLNSLTTYEYQVQAADSECDDPQWSVSQEFTTLNGSVFITDGPWNVGSNWLNGSVPAEGADVIINANAVIPAEYTANVDEVTLSEGGSITIADGGQLFYGSDNLVVTMQKTISAYTDANGTGNYYLLAFPFRDNLEVPAAMTAAEGNDFYTFDNSAQGEEWQNNRQQASAIEEVTAYEGYLYANPSTIDLSFTGTTFGSPAAGFGYPITYTYDADENEESGWLLLGNPLTCNAYIYGESDSGDFPMDVMYYDADGVMQTVSAGPVPPMQGFFVKITEDTKVWFMGAEYNAKSAPKPVNRGTMPVKMNLHKVVPVVK